MMGVVKRPMNHSLPELKRSDLARAAFTMQLMAMK